ncbi:MAG TPA: hypothetical protein PLU87_11170 [Sedimentisphaerales bacterium]|nr:hypothetical protein [Sedimentisphaerales bacterium]HRS11043.1 hypothetical protein [Sedimentisphaerales bacterium]HRV49699.1 hypothetical protein [Sedimentisphaerales bacterium]
MGANKPYEHKPSTRRTHIAGLVGASLSCCLVILGGCANLRITDPSRTATEQFLLSQAAIEAVKPFSFAVLRGYKIFVEDTYFAAAEKEFVLGELRARLLLSGVQISVKREQAEIVLEVRSGGVGIDRYETLLGIPAIGTSAAAAAAGAGVPVASIVTPEIAVTKSVKQIGFASVAYIAYWADTGEVVDSSGPSIGKAYRDDWWFLGFGPRTIGTIPPVDHHIE